MSGSLDSKWSGPNVRRTFIKYFEDREHNVVPSSSVVPPASDTSLMFTNAGMNQFKDIFTNKVSKSDPFSKLKRAVDSQKCIRAGGKHNDLDDVGKDSYHHTCFEMLGNWSFDAYFKEEAISYAWDLLTNTFGLDPQRLYVTYFEGDLAAKLDPDVEAKEIWKKVGVPEDHIITGNMKDNFWEMGDQGPCGPCSEIHYDRIGGRNAAHLVNMDDPNVLEIWNIVFIMYNREPDRSLKLLPARHIDTGMGFERLVSILQNKETNYDTDIFWPLFQKIREVTGAREYTDKYGQDDKDNIDTAYRICADHLRTASFAIADGVTPDKEDAGYVLRRVVRRGARYAKQIFNVNLETERFFSKLLPALVEQMGEQFPELVKKQEHIIEVLDTEEKAFAQTIAKGKVRYDKLASQAKKNGSLRISGVDAFRLYDTYGYPPDVTQLMCEEEGLLLDMAEVKEAELKHKEASKSAKKEEEGFAKPDVHALSEMKGVENTDQKAKYLKGTISSKVLRIFDGKTFLTTTKDIPSQTKIAVVLDKTNFYAEQGGQVADVGKIYDEDVAFEVEDVQQAGGFILHIGYLNYGVLSTGDEVTCQYDEAHRYPILNNHTGTHVLNHSLRKHLGDHIEQEGSLVDTDKLRFDFKHGKACTSEQIKLIEDSSNAYIAQKYQVYSKDVPLELAYKIHGIRAAFGEKYPDPVRVVSVGVDVDTLVATPENTEWQNFSIEFCGGTHVAETSIIKELIIVEESGISAGTRRIIAYTGSKAAEVQRVAEDFASRLKAVGEMEFSPQKETSVKEIANALSTLTVSTLVKDQLKKDLGAIQKSVLSEQKARQKKELKTAIGSVTALLEKPENKDSKYFIARLPTSADTKIVSDVLNHFKKVAKDKSFYVFTTGADDTAVAHGIYVGIEHTKNIEPKAVAKQVSDIVGGNAGGKDPICLGSGDKPSKADDAVALVTKLFEDRLKL